MQLMSVARMNTREILALDRLRYHRLRGGIAAIAVICPAVILLSGLEIAPLLNSFSEYYYISNHCEISMPGSDDNCYLLGNFLRDLFVGALCAIGGLLAQYRGYSRSEDWALNLAGVFVACIALSPMPTAAEGLPILGWPTELSGKIHLISLTCFVFLIAYVAVICSETTLPALVDTEIQQRYRLMYRLIGAEMACMPVIVTVLSFSSVLSDLHIFFVLEVICIWTFAGFWLLKSSEIASIEAQLTGSTAEWNPLTMR